MGLNRNLLNTQLKSTAVIALAFTLLGCGKVQFSTDRDSLEGAPDTPLVLRDVSGSITVANERKVDILFVVDNSGSMQIEQANMAASFPSFADVLNDPQKDLDWQLGIVTTDVTGTDDGEDGNLLPLASVMPPAYILNKDTPNGNTVFQNTVQRPSSGSGDERAIYAAYRLVEKTGTELDRGLIRPAGNLALVILSDEDERSAGGNPDLSQYKPLEEKDKPNVFVDYFKQRFPLKTLSTHAIVIRPTDTECFAKQNNQAQLGTGGKYGVIYKQFVDLSNSIFGTLGILGDICDSNYQQQLSDIGNSIQESIDTYPLECEPYQGLVNLIAASNPATTISVLGQSLKITPSPLPGDTLQFSYQCVVP
jgi:hypothetical protein